MIRNGIWSTKHRGKARGSTPIFGHSRLLVDIVDINELEANKRRDYLVSRAGAKLKPHAKIHKTALMSESTIEAKGICYRTGLWYSDSYTRLVI